MGQLQRHRVGGREFGHGNAHSAQAPTLGRPSPGTWAPSAGSALTSTAWRWLEVPERQGTTSGSTYRLGQWSRCEARGPGC